MFLFCCFFFAVNRDWWINVLSKQAPDQRFTIVIREVAVREMRSDTFYFGAPGCCNLTRTGDVWTSKEAFTGVEWTVEECNTIQFNTVIKCEVKWIEFLIFFFTFLSNKFLHKPTYTKIISDKSNHERQDFISDSRSHIIHEGNLFQAKKKPSGITGSFTS